MQKEMLTKKFGSSTTWLKIGFRNKYNPYEYFRNKYNGLIRKKYNGLIRKKYNHLIRNKGTDPVKILSIHYLHKLINSLKIQRCSSDRHVIVRVQPYRPLPQYTSPSKQYTSLGSFQ